MVKITKGDVFEFVKRELVPANNGRVECADGRYTKEQSQGAIRAFGGDFGIVLAFAGALKSEGTNLDSDEIVERYYRAVREVRGEDTKLYYHTDEHNHKEGKIGCGHASKASDSTNDGLYGVTSDEAADLYKSFANHPKSNVTVLEGEHKEKGVLIVHGNAKDVTHSVNSRNKKGDMFFVVDPARIDSLIDAVTPIFSRGLVVPVDPEDVKANYIKQQNATAELLGADKLPHFRVSVKPNAGFTMQQLPKKKRSTN